MVANVAPSTAQQVQRQPTTHDLVWRETAALAAGLARQWKITKTEVYRRLVDMALRGEIPAPEGSAWITPPSSSSLREKMLKSTAKAVEDIVAVWLPEHPTASKIQVMHYLVSRAHKEQIAPPPG